MTTFKPFTAPETSYQHEHLTLENHVDVINIYGRMSLRADQQSLAQALQLQDYLSAIIAHLQAQPNLPEQQQLSAATWVDNPFQSDQS